jgi:predicted Zn-dependent peptidase
MKASAEKINPEDYILSVLSPEDRLDAAFKIAKEAFKKTSLTVKDIEESVQVIRRKIYGKKK